MNANKAFGLAAFLGFGALLARNTPWAQAGAYFVEPCLKSCLCQGLVEHFNMNQSSDWPRFGAFGTALNEATAANIGNRAGKIGDAVDLAGSTGSFLWKSYAPGVAGFFSIGFWFNADALPASGSRSAFISWDHGNNRGTSVWLYNSAGTTYVCISTINVPADTATEWCNSAAISAATWYYVVAGVDDGDDTPGGRRAFVSVNGGAKQTTTLSYVTRSGFPQVRIGQRPVSGPAGPGDYVFDGAIDELSIWARGLTNSDIALLFNSGSGRSYPFITD